MPPAQSVLIVDILDQRKETGIPSSQPQPAAGVVGVRTSTDHTRHSAIDSC